VFHHAGTEGRLSGPDPKRQSYASFSDPDGLSNLITAGAVTLSGRTRKRG